MHATNCHPRGTKTLYFTAGLKRRNDEVRNYITFRNQRYTAVLEDGTLVFSTAVLAFTGAVENRFAFLGVQTVVYWFFTK